MLLTGVVRPALPPSKKRKAADDSGSDDDAVATVISDALDGTLATPLPSSADIRDAVIPWHAVRVSFFMATCTPPVPLIPYVFAIWHGPKAHAHTLPVYIRHLYTAGTVSLLHMA
jgi:hypothetical protein